MLQFKVLVVHVKVENVRRNRRFPLVLFLLIRRCGLILRCLRRFPLVPSLLQLAQQLINVEWCVDQLFQRRLHF